MTLMRAVIALSLAVPLAAQPELPQWLAEAERLVAEREIDRAFVVLETLQQRAGADSELGRQARELLAKVDPLHAERQKLYAAEAKPLETLAKKYRRKRWWRRVHGLLQQAALGDPTGLQKQLAYAQKRLPKPKDQEAETPAERTDDPGLIGRLKPKWTNGSWKFGSTEVVSPKIQGRSVYTVCPTPNHGNDRIEVEVGLGSAPSTGALLFGGTSDSEYCIAEVRVEADLLADLQLYYWKGGELARLGTGAAKLKPKDVASFMKIAVEIDGRNVRAELNGIPLTEARYPKEPHGGVGFFISGNSERAEPITFRRLTIGEKKQRVAKQAEAAPLSAGQKLRDRIDAIVAGPDREAALLQLETLGESIFLLPAERDLSIELLREHLADLDPYGADAAALRRQQAEARLALAQGYAEKDLPRSAWMLLRHAARFDASVVEPVRAEFKARLPVAARGPSTIAEAEPSGQMHEWFISGRELYGSPGWAIGQDTVTAPEMAKTSGLYVTNQPTPESGSVQVSVQLPGTDAAGGIAFDALHTRAFWVTHIQRRNDRYRIAIARWSGEWTLIGDTELESDAEWIPLRLSWTKNQLTLEAPGIAPIVHEASAETFGQGAIGLFTQNLGGTPTKVRFRNFKVTPEQ